MKGCFSPTLGSPERIRQSTDEKEQCLNAIRHATVNRRGSLSSLNVVVLRTQERAGIFNRVVQLLQFSGCTHYKQLSSTCNFPVPAANSTALSNSNPLPISPRLLQTQPRHPLLVSHSKLNRIDRLQWLLTTISKQVMYFFGLSDVPIARPS